MPQTEQMRVVRHFHGPNRPSDAIRASQSEWISASISAGSDTVRATSSRKSGSKLLSHPVDECLDRDDADLKLFGCLFVRRYHLDCRRGPKKALSAWRVADFPCAAY